MVKSMHQDLELGEEWREEEQSRMTGDVGRMGIGPSPLLLACLPISPPLKLSCAAQLAWRGSIPASNNLHGSPSRKLFPLGLGPSTALLLAISPPLKLSCAAQLGWRCSIPAGNNLHGSPSRKLSPLGIGPSTALLCVPISRVSSDPWPPLTLSCAAELGGRDSIPGINRHGFSPFCERSLVLSGSAPLLCLPIQPSLKPSCAAELGCRCSIPASNPKHGSSSRKRPILGIGPSCVLLCLPILQTSSDPRPSFTLSCAAELGWRDSIPAINRNGSSQFRELGCRDSIPSTRHGCSIRERPLVRIGSSSLLCLPISPPLKLSYPAQLGWTDSIPATRQGSSLRLWLRVPPHSSDPSPPLTLSCVAKFSTRDSIPSIRHGSSLPDNSPTLRREEIGRKHLTRRTRRRTTTTTNSRGHKCRDHDCITLAAHNPEPEKRLFSNLNKDTLRHEPGSLSGAVLLVAGTTVGAGILAIPTVTQEAGFLPSATTCILCWSYMVGTGLLLAEVNVNTMCELGSGRVSLVSMASRTLGRSGFRVTCILYLFYHYTLLVAYIARSSEILSNATGIPLWITGSLFTGIIGGLCFFGSQRVIDGVNGVLVGALIASFTVLVGVAAGGLELESLLVVNLAAVPQSIPIIALSFVYQSVVPVVCTSLEGDLPKVRSAVVLGTAIPLAMFLVWDALILGSIPLSSSDLGGRVVDPLLNLQAGSGIVGPVVEVFSFLAVATSYIGCVLGLADFLADFLKLPLGRRKQSVPYILSVGPPLALAVISPGIFFDALDFAGTYGVLILFGILPAAMAWSERYSDKGLSASIRPLVPGGRLVLGAIIACAGFIVSSDLLSHALPYFSSPAL